MCEIRSILDFVCENCMGRSPFLDIFKEGFFGLLALFPHFDDIEDSFRRTIRFIFISLEVTGGNIKSQALHS
jgi:hypothetical protein